jgi:hypothetical protein
MSHLILGALMLACAVVATLFAADALEQLGQSHAVQHSQDDAAQSSNTH